MKIIDANHKNEAMRHISFNVKDSKGRIIGCNVHTLEYDFVEAPPNAPCYWTDKELGHYYYAMVQATRDGIEYGAAQSGKRFKTAEEREAYIAKRVEASMTAAEKKAGK